MSKIDPLNEAKRRLHQFESICDPSEFGLEKRVKVGGEIQKLFGEKKKIVDREIVACPVCGEELTCITDVKIYMGDTTWHICDETGVQLLHGATNDSGYWKGAVVELTWRCESGHLLRTQYCFHKGTTFKNVWFDGVMHFLPGAMWWR